MKRIRRFDWLRYAMCAAAALFLTSCATPEEKDFSPTLYTKYDRKVIELNEQVARGGLSITEAEKLRQTAFREYLAELKEARLRREVRNW